MAIAYTKKDTQQVFIDPTVVNSHKNAVKKDLANIINDWEKIKKEYQKLANDKGTKGSFKEGVNDAVNACKKRITKTKNRKSGLESKLDSAIQKYTLNMMTTVSELNARVQALESANSADSD